MKLSLYDIKKGVRSWQNYLAPSQPELQVIRAATTTDPWGPTVAEMEAVRDLLIQTEPEYIVNLIIQRVREYSGGGDKGVYSKAVHYVNSGSEWRIVLKCLKLLAYLVIAVDEAIVGVIAEQCPVVETVGTDPVDLSDLTTRGLQRREQHEALLKQRDELLEMLRSPERRDEQRRISAKLQSQASVENIGERRESDVPSYMSSFKVKELDRHKIANSNLKNEIRNQVGHIYHGKENLPGEYTAIGVSGGSLVDFEGDDEAHDQSDDDEDDGFGEEVAASSYKD